MCNLRKLWLCGFSVSVNIKVSQMKVRKVNGMSGTGQLPVTQPESNVTRKVHIMTTMVCSYYTKINSVTCTTLHKLKKLSRIFGVACCPKWFFFCIITPVSMCLLCKKICFSDLNREVLNIPCIPVISHSDINICLEHSSN